MDWKILTVVILGLVIFFTVRQCSEDKATDYDQKQAVERDRLQKQSVARKTEDSRKRKDQLQDDARKARGQRKPAKTEVMESDGFEAVFTTQGAALLRYSLKDPQYLEPPRDWNTGLLDEDAKEYSPVNLVTTNTQNYEMNSPLRFEVYEGLDALLPDADYEVVEKTDKKIVFRHVQPGLPVVITKKFEIDDKMSPYEMWVTISVKNIGNEKVKFRSGLVQQGYQHPSDAKGGIFSKQPNLQHGICRYSDTVYREQWAKIEQPFSGIGNISFVGVETNYFIGAMIPGDDNPASCFIYAAPMHVVRAELRWGEVEIAPGQSKIFKVKNYLGPKRYKLLAAVGHHLQEAVDFGWLWPICHVMLAMLLAFQSVVANWGIAVIVLTVVVKVVLLPLTHRSFKSTERMKALKPEIDAINERYKSDAAAKQKATMDLYKQHKINPLGGCLPMLLQMPIWIALFTTLRTSPELFRAEFFGWIRDLSSPDPYFVTPLVMGVLMFLQQRMTPMAGDPVQAKMMLYIMPIMFTAMMLFLPSGLTLYILVNTVLSIVHQKIVQGRPKNTMIAGNVSRS